MFGRPNVAVREALCSKNTGKCSSEILVLNLSFVKNRMLLMIFAIYAPSFFPLQGKATIVICYICYSSMSHLEHDFIF